MLSRRISTPLIGHFLIVLLLAAFVLSVFSAEKVFADANISACGTLSSSGTYTLTQSISSGVGTTCLTVASAGVIIDGAGFTITGNIDGTNASADQSGYSFTVSNVTVGDITSGGTAEGGSGGAIIIIDSTTGNINTVGGANSTSGADGVNPGESGSSGGTGGAGGSVHVTDSTVGTITTSGGEATSSGGTGAGGSGDSPCTAEGGWGGDAGSGGSGGSITTVNSTTSTKTSTGGASSGSGG